MLVPTLVHSLSDPKFQKYFFHKKGLVKIGSRLLKIEKIVLVGILESTFV